MRKARKSPRAEIPPSGYGRLLPIEDSDKYNNQSWVAELAFDQPGQYAQVLRGWMIIPDVVNKGLKIG